MAEVRITSIIKDARVLAVPLPPQAVEAEQSVLGGLLLRPDAYDRIDWLRAEHFYRGDHRMIYAAIESLVEAGKQADTMLVGDVLRSRGELEQCGGQGYLGSLAANIPSAANIHRYAELVLERWRLREILAKGTDIVDAAFQPGADPLAIAESAEAAFLNVLDTSKGGEMVSFARAVGEAVDAREAPAETRVRMGFPRLDAMLKGGLTAGQLVIIAGRSSMGKSALAWNAAEHVATHRMVAGFTLEMGRAELAERSLAFHETSLLGQAGAVSHLCGLTLQIDESPAVTVSHIRLRCRRIQRQHGLGLIVVDYLQLMSARGENRTQEVGAISRGLKALAKELQVPVIAVAQINRGVENRNDKRPMLSDLRESGDIENDADIVLMIYRDEYYNPNSEARGLAEILVKKQRNGPTGMVPLRFDGPTTRFHHYDGDMPSPAPAKKAAGSFDFKSRQAGDN